MHDLASKHPKKLEELKSLWFSEAGKYFGLPLDDRTPLELLGTPRPQMVKPTDRYIYYPKTLEVPEAVMASTRGRSWKFAAEVELEAKPEGVIFAQGSMFGGYALYIKDGVLKYDYNFVGMESQVIESSEKLPTGKCVLGVEYDMEATQKTSATGTLSLFINDKKVGSKKIKTQLGKFTLSGEGFNVGRDGGAPVTDDYPGDRPWAFSGGTIKQVVVDVSGEAYVDLEKEAIGMMKRD